MFDFALAAVLAATAADPASGDRATITRLIDQLGAETYADRERASRQLVALGEAAWDPLRLAAESHADPLLRRRAKATAAAVMRAVVTEVRAYRGHAGGEGFRAWVTRAAVTPDGRRVLSLGHDTLRVWDFASGAQLRALGDAGGWALALSPDGRRVVAGTGRVVKVWDLDTGREVVRLTGHTDQVWGVALSADGRRAFTGSWDGTVRQWDVATGKETRQLAAGLGQVRCVALTRDGKTLAVASSLRDASPAVLRLWDLAAGGPPRILEGPTQAVSGIAFTPNGRELVSCGFDATVRLWDVASGRQVRRYAGPTDRVQYVAVTPDGRSVVTCGDDRDPGLRVWDRATGRLIYAAEFVGGVLGLAVAPDGRHVVTTGQDGVVRLWRIGQ